MIEPRSIPASHFNMEIDKDKDLGGRLQPGGYTVKNGKWRSFYFLVEVTLESPKGTDIYEAAELASEFMSSRSKARGRIDTSFASITNVKELPCGRKLARLLERANSKVKKVKKQH